MERAVTVSGTAGSVTSPLADLAAAGSAAARHALREWKRSGGRQQAEVDVRRITEEWMRAAGI